jgi:hypothetical protein
MPEDTKPTEDQGHMIPQSRLDEESSRRKAERDARMAAEQRAKELEDRIAQLEDRDKTDVERLTKEREKLEKRATDAEARMQELEAKSVRDGKAALISAAAAKANFHDPSLAAQLLDLEGIEDAGAAERAVKGLAKERQYLVKQDAPEAVRLRKVGVDGQTIDPATEKEKGMVTQDELQKQWGEQMLAGLTGQHVPSEGA